MFINKKMVSSMVLATVVTAGVQFTSMPAAEAGLLDNVLGKDNNLLKQIVKTVTKSDPESLWRLYNDMQHNYYAAAYYSKQAASIGAELLKTEGAKVEAQESVLINASSDNSTSAIDPKIKNMKVTNYKTDVTDFDAFAKKLDKDNTLAIRFKKNREFQKEALKKANGQLGELLAKQALLGDAAEGVVQCINAAMQYQKVRDAMAKEGATMSQLGKAIDKKFKNIKVSKDEIKDRIANVPKG